MLVNGQWTDDEFPVVSLGYTIQQTISDGFVRTDHSG
jgi:hypothetical protein